MLFRNIFQARSKTPTPPITLQRFYVNDHTLFVTKFYLRSIKFSLLNDGKRSKMLKGEIKLNSTEHIQGFITIRKNKYTKAAR